MKVVTKISYADRISTLRKNLFFAAGHTELGEISVERARLITRCYQENEGVPAELLRAKALEKILDEISIYILDGELIVGNNASKPTAVEVFPEYGANWLLNDLDGLPTREADKFNMTDSDRDELRSILTWWKGRTVEDRARSLLGEEEYWYRNRLVYHSAPGSCSGQNSICPDYANILRNGLNGIIKEVESKLRGLDLSYAANLEKRIFYQSVIISLKGVIKFAHRYAELARKLAKEEAEPYRKAEIEEIAEVCEWVPANPARSFHEAVQAFWFIHAAIGLDGACYIVTPGRMDQWLYPYYRNDIDAGKLTKERAQELLECLWIKFNESLLLLPTANAVSQAGQPLTQDITISAVDKNGLDATNELSYMFLDCDKHVRLRQPELVLLLHKSTPEELLRSACELVRLGTGKPKFASLEVLQEMRMADPISYTLEELRDICWVGCGENCICGVERSGDDTVWHTGLTLALELALNNGKSRLTGEQWGLETGDPKKFTTYEEVMDAFRKQLANAVRHRCIHSNAVIMAHSQTAPSPLKSAFVFDCIGRGLDIYKGGAKYNFDVGGEAGITTTGDCLAALKKVVFEDKKLSMPELIDALDNNFEGKEEIRQMLLKAPKFGNDDDYVDLITREIARFDSLEHRKNPHVHEGGMHRITHASVTAGIGFGRMTGATPDGRKAGDVLNEGGVSPHQGRDKNGPTAVMKSVSKLDWQAAYGGVLNMKFSTKALEGEEGISSLAALLRAYHDMGGFHVQFTCVDLKTLRDAQKHPEKYPDLLVRVGAYSGYFIQLSKAQQDDIIARTEHNAVI